MPGENPAPTPAPAPTAPKNPALIIVPASRELRFSTGLEFRAAAADDKSGNLGTIFGYAAVFNSRSNNLGYFVEIVKPGAFSKCLARGDDIVALLAHRTEQLLGRRSAKTLEIREDDKGLYYEAKVPDTQVGRDTITNVKRGDLKGSSFSFGTINDRWYAETTDGVETLVRDLIDVDVYDVGPCTFPAYEATTAEARSLQALLEEGRKRAGKEARSLRRDQITAAHRARMAVWTP